MECPNCGAYNEEDGKACVICGAALPVVGEKPSAEKAPKPEKIEKPAKKAPAAASPVVSTPPAMYQPVPVSKISLSWGPFAGYGQRLTYGGWLVEGQSAKAQALLEAARARFVEQYSPAAQVFLKAFTGASSHTEVEARNYLVFHRGQVSVALNIVPFGRDIFISSATFIKTPLSRVRLGASLVTLLLAAAFFVFFPLWAAEWFYSLQTRGLPQLLQNPSTLFSLLMGLCLVTPVLLAGVILSLVLIAQGWFSWVRRADWFAPWRMDINEFQQDDALALNRTLELTLRAALRDCGLEFTSLTRIFPHP